MSIVPVLYHRSTKAGACAHTHAHNSAGGVEDYLFSMETILQDLICLRGEALCCGKSTPKGSSCPSPGKHCLFTVALLYSPQLLGKCWGQNPLRREVQVTAEPPGARWVELLGCVMGNP